jgi:hypothetical protein
MAIWQFKLSFVPEKWITDRYGALRTTLPREVVDDSPWWAETRPPKEFEMWIDCILPRIDSWSESMRIWGGEDGDTISVCYVDDKKDGVEWIGVRIDARGLSRDFVRDVCELAKRLECLFLTANCEVLLPEESVLLSAFNESNANRYIEDPLSTLLLMKSRGEYVAVGLTEESDANVFPEVPNEALIQLLIEVAESSRFDEDLYQRVLDSIGPDARPQRLMLSISNAVAMYRDQIKKARWGRVVNQPTNEEVEQFRDEIKVYIKALRQRVADFTSLKDLRTKLI